MACEICQKPYVQIIDDDDLNSDVKPHVCCTCGKSFSLKIQLKRHALIHASGAPYICSSCEKTENGDPKSYNLRLAKKNSYTCEICYKNFTTKRLLLRHCKEHAMGDYFCDECNETFESASALKIHITIHKSKRSYSKNASKNEISEMSYVCKDCGKSFAQMQNFEKHCLTHQKHACIHCGRNFVYEGSLQKHYTNGKCKSILGKNGTVNQSSMDANVSSTTGKKHVCDLCGKGFARKSSLEGHLIVHQTDNFDSAGDEFIDDDVSTSHGSDKFEIFKKKFRLPKLKIRKTFSCENCEKVCSSKNALNKHLLMHHLMNDDSKSNEIETLNEICPSSTNGGQNFKDAITNCNSLSLVKNEVEKAETAKGKEQKTYPCLKCNEVFHRKGRLKKHLLTHIEIEKEGQHFSSDDSSELVFQQGKRRRRSKNFACTVCGKRFVGETCLKKHTLKHSEEEIKNGPIVKEKRRKQMKIYTCEFCSEEFTGKKSIFEKHRQSHTPEVCGICDERFVDRQSLREHCKVHVGTEEGRMFMECSQKALDAKNGVLPPEPKVEYIYLVLR